MKITKRQLRQIILEELEEIRTDGRGFSPDVVSKYKTLDNEGEGRMARGQLGRIEELASMIQNMVQDDSDLEEWVESKITKAQDYLSSVLNYMRGEELSEQSLEDTLKEYVAKDRKAQATLNQLSVQEQRILVQVKELMGMSDEKFDELLANPQKLNNMLELIAQEKNVQVAEASRSKKQNCFAKGKYKTFKGKSKCIQRTKDLSKKDADAYVAKVLRDMGEID